MEKAKRKPKEKAKRSRLVQTVAFQFRSNLPFEECRDRLYRLERYSVEVLTTQTVQDEFETCEFRIVSRGAGVEAVGQLRAGLEELTTDVEGYVGERQASYAGHAFLAVIGFVVMAITLIQSRSYGLLNPLWCGVGLFVPLIAGLAWYHDLRERDKMLGAINEVLTLRDSSSL